MIPSSLLEAAIRHGFLSKKISAPCDLRVYGEKLKRKEAMILIEDYVLYLKRFSELSDEVCSNGTHPENVVSTILTLKWGGNEHDYEADGYNEDKLKSFITQTEDSIQGANKLPCYYHPTMTEVGIEDVLHYIDTFDDLSKYDPFKYFDSVRLPTIAEDVKVLPTPSLSLGNEDDSSDRLTVVKSLVHATVVFKRKNFCLMSAMYDEEESPKDGFVIEQHDKAVIYESSYVGQLSDFVDDRIRSEIQETMSFNCEKISLLENTPFRCIGLMVTKELEENTYETAGEGLAHICSIMAFNQKALNTTIFLSDEPLATQNELDTLNPDILLFALANDKGSDVKLGHRRQMTCPGSIDCNSIQMSILKHNDGTEKQSRREQEYVMDYVRSCIDQKLTDEQQATLYTCFELLNYGADYKDFINGDLDLRVLLVNDSIRERMKYLTEMMMNLPTDEQRDAMNSDLEKIVKEFGIPCNLAVQLWQALTKFNSSSKLIFDQDVVKKIRPSFIRQGVSAVFYTTMMLNKMDMLSQSMQMLLATKEMFKDVDPMDREQFYEVYDEAYNLSSELLGDRIPREKLDEMSMEEIIADTDVGRASQINLSQSLIRSTRFVCQRAIFEFVPACLALDVVSFADSQGEDILLPGEKYTDFFSRLRMIANTTLTMTPMELAMCFLEKIFVSLPTEELNDIENCSAMIDIAQERISNSPLMTISQSIFDSNEATFLAVTEVGPKIVNMHIERWGYMFKEALNDVTKSEGIKLEDCTPNSIFWHFLNKDQSPDACSDYEDMHNRLDKIVERHLK